MNHTIELDIDDLGDQVDEILRCTKCGTGVNLWGKTKTQAIKILEERVCNG